MKGFVILFNKVHACKADDHSKTITEQHIRLATKKNMNPPPNYWELGAVFNTFKRVIVDHTLLPILASDHALDLELKNKKSKIKKRNGLKPVSPM